MKNYGAITDPKDLVTKEYADTPFETVGGDTLTWDGDVSGKEIVGDMVCHISDIVVTESDCANGVLVTFSDGSTANGAATALVDGLIMLADSEGTLCVATDNLEFNGMVFPKKGIYVVYGDYHVTSLAINGYTGFGSTKLKESYLPDGLATEQYVQDYVSENAGSGGDTVTAEATTSAMTVYKVATQTLTTSAAQVVMGNTLFNVGDLFTLSDGGILVNEGCRVAISANLYVSSGLTSGDVVAIQIWKNSTNITTVLIDKVAKTAGSFEVSPVILGVNAGDVIKLYAYNSTGARGTLGTGTGNRITVQEIPTISVSGVLEDLLDGNVVDIAHGGTGATTAEEALANLGDCYRAGDTVTFGIHTAGYVTNSGNTVRFIVPLAKPMIGSPTISMSSIDGFILRQNGVYTHGSSATKYVTPSECYTIGNTSGNAVVVSAKFDDVTNVTNNDTIAVIWSGTITFS